MGMPGQPSASWLFSVVKSAERAGGYRGNCQRSCVSIFNAWQFFPFPALPIAPFVVGGFPAKAVGIAAVFTTDLEGA